MEADPKLSVKEKIDKILGKINKNEVSKKEIEWLENIYRITVIKKHFSNSNSRKWLNSHALIALVCIVLGGLLLVFRVGDIPVIGFLSTNNISIQARCKALQISLMDSERTNIIDFDELVLTDHLEINNLNSVVVSNALISINDSSPSLDLQLSADEIFLDAIELGMESVLKIKQFQDVIHMANNSSYIKINASFKSAEFLKPVKQKVYSKEKFDIPLFARFESMNNENNEVLIKFRQKEPVNILKGRKISSLLFSDSYIYGADILRYISTIQSGTLTLNDVNRSIDLHKQDRLILQNLEGWLVEFSIENGSIDLFFKGTVRDINAGPEGSQKDLSPSLLEYLFKNQPLTLFWGAVVFLWGLLNGILSHIKLS